MGNSSYVLKKSVTTKAGCTSVALEPMFWDVLSEFMPHWGDLRRLIEAALPTTDADNLTSRLRVIALKWCQSGMTAEQYRASLGMDNTGFVPKVRPPRPQRPVRIVRLRNGLSRHPAHLEPAPWAAEMADWAEVA